MTRQCAWFRRGAPSSTASAITPAIKTATFIETGTATAPLDFANVLTAAATGLAGVAGATVLRVAATGITAAAIIFTTAAVTTVIALVGCSPCAIAAPEVGSGELIWNSPAGPVSMPVLGMKVELSVTGMMVSAAQPAVPWKLYRQLRGKRGNTNCRLFGALSRALWRFSVQKNNTALRPL